MATEQNIKIDQGSRYRAVIDVSISFLSDLTGYSARGVVRESQTIDGPVLFDFSSYLTVDEVNSQVVLDIPANATIDADWTAGHYDIELFNGDPTKDVRIMQGEMTLNPEVTR